MEENHLSQFGWHYLTLPSCFDKNVDANRDKRVSYYIQNSQEIKVNQINYYKENDPKLTDNSDEGSQNKKQF